MKNDTLPQFNANPCVQQSHLQIFLWRKGSYAYFADEKTDADEKTETSKKWWVSEKRRRSQRLQLNLEFDS